MSSCHHVIMSSKVICDKCSLCIRAVEIMRPFTMIITSPPWISHLACQGRYKRHCSFISLAFQSFSWKKNNAMMKIVIIRIFLIILTRLHSSWKNNARIILIILTRLHTSWGNDQRSQPPTRHHPVLHQADDRKGEKHGWSK